MDIKDEQKSVVIYFCRLLGEWIDLNFCQWQQNRLLLERERLLYVCQISGKLSMFLGWFHQHLTFSLVVQLCCCIFGANFKLKCFLTFFVVKLKYHLSAYYCFGKHCMELLLWDELTFLSNTNFFLFLLLILNIAL